MQVSTALRSLCVCCRLRLLCSGRRYTVAFELVSIYWCLLGRLWINCRLQVWIVVLQCAQKMELLSNRMVDRLCLDCRCLSFGVWILALSLTILFVCFNYFLRFLNTVLDGSCQWVTLIDSCLIQRSFSPISFGCLWWIQMRCNLYT